MQRSSRIIVGLLLGTLVATSVYAYPSIFPTGITRSDLSEVYPGAVIFTARNGRVYAIDPEGNLVNSWSSPFAESPLLGNSKPLDNGNLLVHPSSGPVPMCGLQCGERIIELDQQNNVVWEYEDTEGRFLHHDAERLSNGNTLLMCWVDIDRPEISDKTIQDDCIIEVDTDGNVVWTWQTADHFDQFGFTDEAKDLIFEAGGNWAHGNSMYVVPENTSHTDPRFAPGNIIIGYRLINSIIVIDRTTGDIVWVNDDTTIGQHSPHMIEDGLDGAGNIIVFDNGGPTGYPLNGRFFSRVLEIDPTDDSVDYEYTATSSGFAAWTFYSHFMGSAQRLPNGNTLINEGKTGRIFEIAPGGNIVWEMVSPVFGQLPDGSRVNHVFRATKVPLDWGK